MNLRFKALPCVAALMLTLLVGCSTDAERAAYRARGVPLEEHRRLVFYDVPKSVYVLAIEGRCHKVDDTQRQQWWISCQVGPGTSKAHSMRMSPDLTVFAEQLGELPSGAYPYRVTFNPSVKFLNEGAGPPPREEGIQHGN